MKIYAATDDYLLLRAHACSLVYLDGDMLMQFCWFYSTYVLSMYICFLLLTVSFPP